MPDKEPRTNPPEPVREKPFVKCPRCGELNDFPRSYLFYHGKTRCMECGSVFEVHFRGGLIQETPRLLPPDDIDLSSPPVPTEIQMDLKEAGLCFSVGAPRATVVLCRRALEGVADNLKANGRTLSQKIESIYERELITKPVYEASTEIRVFGNYGAHPGKDLLEDIDSDLAEDVLYFTREVVDDVYVKPDRLERLQRRRADSDSDGI